MLVAAISGGAAIPAATGALATSTNFHTAMAIPAAFYVLAWAFPIYANVFNAKSLDGHRSTDLNITPRVHDTKNIEEARGDSIAGPDGEKGGDVTQVESGR